LRIISGSRDVKKSIKTMMIKEKKTEYRADRDGSFLIENYSQAKPFSNFLPAVAGPFGVPLWAFYVNRGQGIASFGVSDKDHAIMEFFPANRSYEHTSLRGFRTFLKVMQKKEYAFYEPFQNHLEQQKYDLTQSMKVYSAGFSLAERNMSLGLDVHVNYFGVPNEPFAALGRKVTLQNTLGVPVSVEVLDGLPVIVPFGLKESFLKNMSRTVEAWMQTEFHDRKPPAAFFKLKTDPEDRPEFRSVDGAHFYTAFAQNSQDRHKAKTIFPILIVDPETVFGANLDFVDPRSFLTQTPFAKDLVQFQENKTPCAFSFFQVTLDPGASVSFYSLIGECKERSRFAKMLTRICDPAYFEKKEKESRDLVSRLQDPATMISASSRYDNYCRQTFLDNILRGGYPQRIPTEKGNFIFHMYSRKHGDLERDYNRFVIQPTYFSQGEGNFRDVNQNRRNDVWFEPEVKDLNVRTFFNLIQPDGYNPLIAEQLKLRFDAPKALKNRLSKLLPAEDRDALAAFLKTSRTPGEIFKVLEECGTTTEVRQDVFRLIFSCAKRWETARHGEGFWSEHWTYNLDALESFLAVYPEELENILLRQKNFTFYDNAYRTKPRSQKYVRLSNGKIRQYQAVFLDHEKEELIAARLVDPDKVRTRNGKGKIYECSLLTKILCIIANKFASLDPFGIGLEMEADKPDWFDALNGLPGLFGSTLSGSYELLRLVRFVLKSMEEVKLSRQRAAVAVPMELAQLLRKNELATRKFFGSRKKTKGMDFWHATHQAKELYWENTRLGFKGTEVKLRLSQLKKALHWFERKLEEGIHRAYDPVKEVCPTYFMHEVEDYAVRQVKVRGQNRKALLSEVILPKKFKQRPLAPFLEGPVHALKVENDSEKLLHIYNHVRGSDLFDRKLGMYCVTSSLDKESPEIGRARVFAKGWLENQSIFLHMEYKWLLELLRKGLHTQFFTDFHTALVPFQDPKVYGRSIFENSSFIASSNFINPKLHGTGFVARLSGSTAEFMDMWIKMNVGLRPFRLNEKGHLEFHLSPILPDWIFTKEEIRRQVVLRDGTSFHLTLPKSSYAFVLMGQTLVTYFNPKRIATFGPRRAVVKRMVFHDAQKKPVMVSGPVLDSTYARQLRDGIIKRLDVELG